MTDQNKPLCDLYRSHDYLDDVAWLLGRTLTEIRQVGVKELHFVCDTGEVLQMYHEQDCCEHVQLAEVIGDLDDLVGHPILSAEENTSPGVRADGYDYDGSENRWTFYNIRTVEGAVTLRWVGESNGYYSISVDLMAWSEPVGTTEAGRPVSP